MHYKYILIIIIVIISMIQDCIENRVSNKLIGCFIFIGLLINLITSGYKGCFDSILGIVLPVISLWVLFRIRAMGAGDIKLFSCIGAICGMKFVIWTICLSFLAGGVICIILLFYKKSSLSSFNKMWMYLNNCLISKKVVSTSERGFHKFPFTIAVFFGVVVGVLVV